MEIPGHLVGVGGGGRFSVGGGGGDFLIFSDKIAVID